MDTGGDAEDPSPFGVADYVQLAGMSARSAVLEIHGLLAGRGTIVIHHGMLWSAEDERGIGFEAFRRLVFLSDATVHCHPLDERLLVHPRTLGGSCEAALLDAARLHDESSAMLVAKLSSSPPPPADVDREWERLGSMRPKASSTVRARPSRIPPPLPNKKPAVQPRPVAPKIETFDDHYEAGVDALLGKRFAEALAAFRAAEAVRPGDRRVRANIERLEQMGYGS
ncbi:hypothetical protein AKJ09_07486 [Labilithrix luteola]|uniref:Uncharacterized protein n=1 Tax=Labilithrix luteola TaxID=1391654 RepID=A0A0K1Q517_9BACT|nr:hypothetical protein AKJ09_07486 [Labilithrix luteola]